MSDFRDWQLKNELENIFYWNSQEDLKQQEQEREQKEIKKIIRLYPVPLFGGIK